MYSVGILIFRLQMKAKLIHMFVLRMYWNGIVRNVMKMHFMQERKRNSNSLLIPFAIASWVSSCPSFLTLSHSQFTNKIGTCRCRPPKSKCPPTHRHHRPYKSVFNPMLRWVYGFFRTWTGCRFLLEKSTLG